MKVVLLPIDNRPVTYLFPQLIGSIAGIETIVPPRHLMGSLSAAQDLDGLLNWLDHAINNAAPDALVVCLDSLLYGGLISSRRTEDSADQVLQRTKAIGRWKKQRPAMQILAQASIMRISDNYDNTEEKRYWANYGRDIFAWSEALHRLSTGQQLPAGELARLEARIPEDVRQDYLATRWRNFRVNTALINLAREGALDFLVFSQDDSGEFGLNVHEKERLLEQSKRLKAENVLGYAGADEVLSTLMARLLVKSASSAPETATIFAPPEGEMASSRYEGQTIGETVRNQTKAAGLATISGPRQPDFTIIVHTAGNRQGDHIHLPGQPDLTSLNTNTAVQRTLEYLEETASPCVLCDVAYANGADPLLVDELLKKPQLLQKLWGYAGWNTTGNTVGSALSMATARWYAERKGLSKPSQDNFMRALFVRLADDWAYQTQVRKQMPQQNPDVQVLSENMRPYLQKVATALQLNPGQINLNFPWNRPFEVEVGLSQPSSVR